MNYLLIDVETSSLDHKYGCILELAAIPVINGVKGEHFHSFLRPHKNALIDDAALKVNKFTKEQIETFPDPSEVLDSFIQWIDKHETMFSLMGHNISFDRKFLYALFTRNMKHTDFVNRIRPSDYCTLENARRIFKNRRAKPDKMNLAALCKFFNINLENAHSALPDIEATYELYMALDALTPKIQHSQKMTYQEKKRIYMDANYIQFNADGDIFINSQATKNPEIMKFITEELYNIYGS